MAHTCPSCGESNGDTATMCGMCGAMLRLPVSAAVRSTTPPAQDASDADESAVDWPRILTRATLTLIIIGVLLPILATRWDNRTFYFGFTDLLNGLSKDVGTVITHFPSYNFTLLPNGFVCAEVSPLEWGKDFGYLGPFTGYLFGLFGPLFLALGFIFTLAARARQLIIMRLTTATTLSLAGYMLFSLHVFCTSDERLYSSYFPCLALPVLLLAGVSMVATTAYFMLRKD